MSLLERITDQQDLSDVDLRLGRRRMALIQQINDYLDEKGLSKQELAGKMGKSPSQISRLLSLTCNPTLRTLVEVEEALGEELFIFERNLKYKVTDDQLEEGKVITSQPEQASKSKTNEGVKMANQIREHEVGSNAEKIYSRSTGKSSGTHPVR